MEESAVSDHPERNIRTTMAAERAARVEVEQRIRNADRYGRTFTTKAIIPALRSAEAQLRAVAVKASVSAHFDPHCMRCVLTVPVDPDRVPETLAFEVVPGAAFPQMRWTVGGIARGAGEMEGTKVEEIVRGFVEHVLRVRGRRQ